MLLPLIAKSLDQLMGAKFFTKLDVRDTYHLVRIHEGDEWKTTFRTHYRHFKYTVLPIGLTNVPATFQRLINKTLAKLLDIYYVAYLDDILIYSSNPSQHVEHVRLVLERLRSAGLFANTDKCDFHLSEVEFLGYLVSSSGIFTRRRCRAHEILRRQSCSTPCRLYSGPGSPPRESTSVSSHPCRDHPHL